jgi:hypothetical protein
VLYLNLFFYNIIHCQIKTLGRKIFRMAYARLVRHEMTYIWKPVPLDQIPKETIDKVVAALENNEYDWRTIDGITRETNLSFNDIFSVLTKLELEGKLVRARNPDEKGRDLFTTRDYYNKSRGFIDKIRSSLADGPV